MPNALFDKKIIIYTDGGSRGNPGPAAVGIVIGGKKYGQTIGFATNNEAEYQAVIIAFKKVKQLVGKKACKETELEFNLDSELVVKQLNGKYKILEPNLQPLFLEIWNSKQDFKKAEFKHIPREKNIEADKLVNQTLGDRI